MPFPLARSQCLLRLPFVAGILARIPPLNGKLSVAEFTASSTTPSARWYPCPYPSPFETGEHIMRVIAAKWTVLQLAWFCSHPISLHRSFPFPNIVRLLPTIGNCCPYAPAMRVDRRIYVARVINGNDRSIVR